MRVIAGSAKGYHLKGPRRAGVRPTTDLVRGALFSLLEAMGADFSRVLDLYAGTGSLGIEALSRGTGWCDFVERDPAACAVIRHNLSVTHLAERATVHRMPVERAPAALQGPYTLILLDPPFDDPGALVLLQELVRSSLADPDTIIAIEHSRRQEAPGSLLPGPPGPGLPRRGIALPVWAAFTAVARRRYGDSCLTIYGQESPSNTQEGEEHAESREQAGQGVK